MDYLASDQVALRGEYEELQRQYDSFKAMDLKLDMSRGKPSPNQLDLSMGMLQIQDYKDDTGVDARSYSHLEGLPEARRFFAELLGAQPEETFVAGNSSLQMMNTLIEMGWHVGFADSKNPWRAEEKIKFLCPSPGYDRHFRITENYGFELITVPMTPNGPDMDVVEELVKDEAVKGMWCVPIYTNPDGYVYSSETVQRLADMATAAKDFKIFWDNAYSVHHFTEEHCTCPNMLTEARKAGNENRVLMFCSTSKITFAGAGVAAIATSVTNMQKISDYIFSTTIGYDKMNQLRHVRFLKQEGGIAAHMQKHAALVAPKFEMVIKVLHDELDGCGEIACWTEPKGGYFVSFYTMNGCAKRVVELCKEAGVVLTGAGAAFPYGVDPSDNHIRIAPTFPPLHELETAARLLCVATRLATVEKLLS